MDTIAITVPTVALITNMKYHNAKLMIRSLQTEREILQRKQITHQLAIEQIDRAIKRVQAEMMADSVAQWGPAEVEAQNQIEL